MPELPEVETVVRSLRDTVQDKTIKSIRLDSPKIDSDNPPGWLDILRGKRLISIRRRGKNILIDLSGNYTLWVHLKMTGHFYWLDDSHPIDRHDLMIISFKSEKNTLRFNDYRRFGRVRLFKTDEISNQKGMAELGPEPLEINVNDFIALFKTRKRMIKPALLDQTFIAGLGNIYADEVLFSCRINPFKSTDKMSAKKLAELHRTVQSVLKKAIQFMGTTVDSFAGVNGKPGQYQKYLKIYGREGQPCDICGTKVRRVKIGSRSAHFCPRCQRQK
jgi:formamidopyrimidine-DNA glycosylase